MNLLFSETFICTAREKEQVLASCRLNKSTDGKLCFDEPLKFQNLSKDFVICIELFKRRNKEVRI